MGGKGIMIEFSDILRSWNCLTGIEVVSGVVVLQESNIMPDLCLRVALLIN